jgi:glycerate kinase
MICRPIADGGEGTAEALREAMGGCWVRERVTGPLPDMTVEAAFVHIPREGIAVVEMAAAAGLPMVPAGLRNPERTTTHGVGQLLDAAAARSPRRILLTLGGSATVDGGVGMAMALGWRFFDDEGAPVGLGGAALYRIARIDGDRALRLPPIDALCDVRHTLVGPEGAARVFGPQKGANAAMVERLESGLERLADLIERQLGIPVRDLPGGGAAGGLGAAAVAFLGARLTPGVEAVLRAVRLDDALRDADWVITGEGRFDATSLRGKAVSGVAAAAHRAGARVAVLAGHVALHPAEWRAAGITEACSMVSGAFTEEDAIRHAAARLRAIAEDWARRSLV